MNILEGGIPLTPPQISYQDYSLLDNQDQEDAVHDQKYTITQKLIDNDYLEEECLQAHGERTPASNKFFAGRYPDNYINGLVYTPDKQRFVEITANTTNISLKPVASFGTVVEQEILTLNPETPEVKAHAEKLLGLLKERIKEAPLSMRHRIELVVLYVRKHIFPKLPGDLEGQVEEFVESLPKDPSSCLTAVNGEMHRIVPIEKFFNKAAVCRHHALITAYLLDFLVQQEILPRCIVQYMRDNMKEGAHVWNTVTTPFGEVFLVDSLWRVVKNIKNDEEENFVKRHYGQEIITSQHQRTRKSLSFCTQLSGLKDFEKNKSQKNSMNYPPDTKAFEKLEEPFGKENSALRKATREGNIEEIKKLLKTEGCSVHVKNVNGCTPLHYAAEKGYVEIIKLFLENEAPLYAKDNFGNLAFHRALMNKHWEAAQILLDSGPVDFDLSDKHQRTPLTFFIEATRNEPRIPHAAELLFERMLAETNIGFLPSCGDTYIHEAIKNNNIPVLKRLLELEDASYIASVKNCDGKTAWDLAKGEALDLLQKTRREN